MSNTISKFKIVLPAYKHYIKIYLTSPHLYLVPSSYAWYGPHFKNTPLGTVLIELWYGPPAEINICFVLRKCVEHTKIISSVYKE